MGDHLKYEHIPNQTYTLSGIVPKEVTNTDRRNDSTVNDIYYVKQLLVSILGECSLQQIEKPGFHKNISYLVIKDDIILGHFGQLSIEMQDNYELDKPVYLFSIDLTNVDKDHLVQVNYKPLSPYPFVKFDLSFIVNPSFNAQDLINEVEHILSENENILTIFDDFKNEKTRNLGIRISTRSYTKTYSEDEVSDVLNQIVETVEAKFSIKLNKGK
jgi:phenylalanyl-tRNA synthetase beta subunit